MNSIIRAASRIVLRPTLNRVALFSKPIVARRNISITQQRWAHNAPCTYDFARERILLCLKMFDKIDGEKLTLDSHFQNDLGLDSLDHVEIMINIEDEFLFEIPDKDAERLVTPRHILTYITDHQEAYEALQDIEKSQPHHHYDYHLINKPEHGHHDDHHDQHHASDHHAVHQSHEQTTSKVQHQQTRSFSTLSHMAKRFAHDGRTYDTTFYERPPKEVKINDIQARVLSVCSKYDKIDSSILKLESHFVQDLGLDSLDHVEIMMELEDEFGLEIPDKDAEKLMRPVEIAKYVFKIEEKRAMVPEERPY